MSRLGNIGLALESEVDMLTGTGDSTVTPEDIQDASSIEEQVADVSADNDAMSSAEADIEVVEEIQEVLEEAAASGEGVSETAAQIATIVVESLRDKLGLKGFTRPMPSLESFGTTSSRVTATNLAIEAIGDTVSRAWEAVKAFFKKIWEKIKNFYRDNITAAGRLQKRAEALRKSVSEKGGAYKPTDSSFENSTIAKQFCAQDKSKVELTDIGRVVTGTSKLFDAAIGAIKGFSKVAENTTTLGNNGVTALEPLKTNVPVYGVSSDYGLSGTVHHVVNQLNGKDFLIELTVEAEGISGIKRKEKKDNFKVGFVGMREKTATSREVDETVPVLGKPEMLAAVDAAITYAKKLKDFKLIQDGIEKMLKAVDKAAKEATTAVSNSVTVQQADNKKEFYNLGKLSNALALHAPAAALRTGLALCNYTETSLRYYKKD